MPERPLSRRSVLRTALVTGGLASAAGCTGRDPEPPDPRLVLLRDVIAEKRRVIETYRATIQARPKLTGRLDPILADHQAHLEILERHLPPGTPSPSAKKQARASVRTVRALSRLERDAAASRPGQTLTAGPALAQVLASIGASEAGHARRLS